MVEVTTKSTVIRFLTAVEEVEAIRTRLTLDEFTVLKTVLLRAAHENGL
jgi:hypothetical protein